jgi:hypothetical protein
VFEPESDTLPLKYWSASGAPPIPTESITTRKTLAIQIISFKKREFAFFFLDEIIAAA